MKTTWALALGIASIVAASACGDDEDESSTVTESATIAPFGTGVVTGSLTITQVEGAKPTITITLENCGDEVHPVHIHQGTSCADATAQGGHWGIGTAIDVMGARGEGIPNVTCSGGSGSVTYENAYEEADRIWTLGGAADTDPKGHAFVVHMNDEAKTRVGCGIID